jgi:acyl carrier protein
MQRLGIETKDSLISLIDQLKMRFWLTWSLKTMLPSPNHQKPDGSMDNNTILNTLHDIFADILDNENIHLTPETTARDIEEWDSLNHIQLVVAIERKFGIRFRSAEIQSWNNVGEMVSSIYLKINNLK